MLYIIRHGKTDWNKSEKLQGKVDIPLNDEGRNQIIKTRAENKVKFDYCFCSPLQRARETAELLLEGSSTKIIFDKRLEEMGFGKYEGIEGYFKITDSPITKLFHEPEKFEAQDGVESFDELFKRTGDILENEIEPLLKEGKNVLIVGHGAMNCSIISRVRGYSLDRFWDALTGNCELLRLK